MNSTFFAFGGFVLGVAAGAVLGLVLEHQLGLCDEVCDLLDKHLEEYLNEEDKDLAQETF
jgi:demethoxyubiquinone hydroxylase (CLK1/Coq7/Cat5 family)